MCFYTHLQHNSIMIEIIRPLIKQFMPFAQKHMGFTSPPKLFLRTDNKNAKKPLGRTAYYDPEQKSITVYISDRHPKDVMRSISHELVHHTQQCRGDFDGEHDTGPGYAQNDKHMREMEREAYEIGNMCFRDWEDSIKNTIYNEHLQKGDKKMSTKDWKNKEIGTLLSEAWGFKFNSLEEFNEFNGEGELQAESEEEIDEGRGKKKKVEEADDDLDEGRGGRGDKDKKEKITRMKEEEELEEVAASSGRQSPHADRRGDDERKRPMEENEELEEKLGDGKTQGTDSQDAGLDYNPKFTGKDFAAEKGGERGKKGKKPTKEQIEALVKKALQEALQKRKG